MGTAAIAPLHHKIIRAIRIQWERDVHGMGQDHVRVFINVLGTHLPSRNERIAHIRRHDIGQLELREYVLK